MKRKRQLNAKIRRDHAFWDRKPDYAEDFEEVMRLVAVGISLGPPWMPNCREGSWAFGHDQVQMGDMPRDF